MPRSLEAQKTALVVIGEPAVRELVAVNLRRIGMFAMTVGTAAEAKRLASEVLPDLVLLDLDSGAAEDNASLANELIAKGRTVAVLMSARAEPLPAASEQAGSQLAVSLRKPFAPQDLLQLVRQQLRRHSEAANAIHQQRLLRHGPLEVDVEERMAKIATPSGRHNLNLSPVELKLLTYLMSNANRLSTREGILMGVWGQGSTVDVRTVDQTIRRLRHSFGSAGATDLIETVRGFGYRLAET